MNNQKLIPGEFYDALGKTCVLFLGNSSNSEIMSDEVKEIVREAIGKKDGFGFVAEIDDGYCVVALENEPTIVEGKVSLRGSATQKFYHRTGDFGRRDFPHVSELYNKCLEVATQ